MEDWQMLKPLINFDYWGFPIYMIMGIAGIMAAILYITDVQDGMRCTAAIKTKINRSFAIAFAAGMLCSNIANWFLFPEILNYSLGQRLTDGGFSFYYGLCGFFVVAAILLKTSNVDHKFWINQFIPSVLIFHAFGRVGCSLSGCCYGKEISLLGIHFAFPARETEAIALFIMFFIFRKKIKEHRLFWYLVYYSLLRFLLEFGRADDRGIMLVDWLSPAQITSILIWVGLVFYRKRLIMKR